MNVAVFGSSSVDASEPDFRVGVELGRLLATDGHAVFTGGYGGLMEAVSMGARDAGGRVVGVVSSAVFPGRSGPNPYLTEVVDCPTLSGRIHALIDATEAAIALPGSIGTLTELMVAWNDAFVARFSGVGARPVIALGDGWRRLVAELGRTVATDTGLVTFAEDPRAAIEILRTLRRGE